jgi:tRNA threonylcarbamoyladenosine biosynthesis protein TsaE
MRQIKSFIYTLDSLQEAANWLIENAGDYKIWCFNGEMGAGKTTLIKALCEQMGVNQNVNSPTFSIVNEYQLQQGGFIYHFDFYRIKDEEEAYDIGYETYFESGSICLVEWPVKIANILSGERCLLIEIELFEKHRILRILE